MPQKAQVIQYYTSLHEAQDAHTPLGTRYHYAYHCPDGRYARADFLFPPAHIDAPDKRWGWKLVARREPGGRWEDWSAVTPALPPPG